MTTKQLLKSSIAALSTFLVGGLLAVALLAVTRSAVAFTEPSLTPPSVGATEVPTLLNGSAFYQRKLGSLLIGTSSRPQKLCLNPVLHDGSGLSVYPGTSDPVNCVSSWSDLAGLLIDSTKYLRLLGVPTHNAGVPTSADDTIDNGYINVQASDLSGYTAQTLTLIAEANPTGTGNPTAGIFGDGVVGANYAATFAGRLGVFADGGLPTKLCLNDLASGGNPLTDCISHWSDVSVASDSTLVRLQTVTSEVAPVVNQGNVSSSGVLVAPSLVAGSPVIGTAVVLSCGDGVCSVNEGRSLCSLDCP